MKKYKLNAWGLVPDDILKMMSRYDGLPADEDEFTNLDEDMTFWVCEMKQAAGNIDFNGGCWMCSPNNANQTWGLKVVVI